MKKIILMSLIGIVLFTSVNAQLSVNASGFVGVGTTNMLARFNIQPQLSEPSATNLQIGNYNTTTEGSINIGVHNDYAWMQTWNSKPLYINSKGNDVLFFHDVQWGKVGINVLAPSCALQVQGNIIASGTVTWSDNNLKKNMNKLSLNMDLISKIHQLEPISYDWSDDLINNANQLNNGIGKIDKDFFNRTQYGFSAQEVQKIFPELVYEDGTGTLGINYQGFIPMLFTMIQDQGAKIKELNNEIVTIKNDCCASSQLKSAKVSNADNDNLTSKNVLFQNSPNPFTITTTIRFSLSNDINNAMINIYNMNGTQLKSIELHQKGDASITVNGNEFKAGMYLYALIADGQVIDTKRMVLTD